MPHLLQEEGELEIALIKLDADDAVHVLQHLAVLVRHHGTAEIVTEPAVRRVREAGVPLLEWFLRASLRHKLDGARGCGVEGGDVHLVDLLTRWRREIELTKGTAKAATVGVLPQIVLRLRRQLGIGLSNVCDQMCSAIEPSVHLPRMSAPNSSANLPPSLSHNSQSASTSLSK